MATIRRKRKRNEFQWQPFTKKQLKTMTWWVDGSGVSDAFMILLDGAVRSGKTLPSSVSFVNWAMTTFDDSDFIVSGKTVGAFRRNVIQPWMSALPSLGYDIEYYRTDGIFVVAKNNITNYFHVFGGDKENSQDKVQGFTASGAFLDEVPLMPRSFINQVIARCSVEKAKIFMTSNPDHPKHWYKTDFIDRSAERNALFLRFNMDDNPSLSEAVKERYKNQYSGVFYRRNILGEWCVAEGLVFSEYNPAYSDVGGNKVKQSEVDRMVVDKKFIEYIAGVDWGYRDPLTASIWGVTSDNRFYKIKEFYKTERLTIDVINWFKEQESGYLHKPIRTIYCDSAEQDRINELRKASLPAVNGAKEKKAAINTVNTLLRHKKIFISDKCKETDREYLVYSYPSKDDLRMGQDLDKPLDGDDHVPDSDMYCLHSYAKRYGGLYEILTRKKKGVTIEHL